MRKGPTKSRNKNSVLIQSHNNATVSSAAAPVDGFFINFTPLMSPFELQVSANSTFTTCDTHSRSLHYNNSIPQRESDN